MITLTQDEIERMIAHEVGRAIKAEHADAEATLAAKDARITELEQELHDRDVVPRSRYNACNQDWLDALKELERVRGVAKIELTAKDEELARVKSELHRLSVVMIDKDEELMRIKQAQADLLADAVEFAKELVFIERQRQLPVTTPVFVSAHAFLARPDVQAMKQAQQRRMG
jgi:chromosome segregation ATPase